eukprot:SAG22_NODE_4528_length_1242_cov_1.227273_1_plen_48_part_10
MHSAAIYWVKCMFVILLDGGYDEGVRLPGLVTPPRPNLTPRPALAPTP